MENGYKQAIKLIAQTRGGQVCGPYWSRLLLATILLVVASPWSLAASQPGSQPEDLDTTVQYLITYVKDSDVTFERNSGRYTAREAAEHINNKYRHFKDDIDTPEKFIELCATGSLVTGRPYFIITRQGEQLPSGEWLNAELSVYRLRNGHGDR
jgi:hypothetical protein